MSVTVGVLALASSFTRFTSVIVVKYVRSEKKRIRLADSPTNKSFVRCLEISKINSNLIWI